MCMAWNLLFMVEVWNLPLICEVWKADFSTLCTMDFPCRTFIHSISVDQRMSISHCCTGSSLRFLSQWVTLKTVVKICFHSITKIMYKNTYIYSILHFLHLSTEKCFLFNFNNQIVGFFPN